jgi:hypothetical protein
MRQLVQEVSGGHLRLVEAPMPEVGPTEVLVAPTRSVLSPGTERAVRSIASEGLVGKARARPDLVRQVVAKARTEGVRATSRAVRDRLDQAMPLGYSSAGTVLEVGSAVAGLVPGQRVAAAGAGHGEVQVVAGLLAVPVPDAVTDEQAAFGALGAIALHAARAADAQPGSLVAVVGMGLLGRLVARAAAAAGASVVALDVRAEALAGPDPVVASILLGTSSDPADEVHRLAHGRGVDAVVVAAADPSGDAVALAPRLLRDRGTVVVVGDAALALDRRTLYEGEVTVRVVRSYGPGRHEPSYEQLGVDLPPGYVRWTAGRNVEAYLALVASGRLSVDELVGHVVPFDEAERAYALLEQDRRPVAVQLAYSSTPAARPWPTPRLSHRATSVAGVPRVGVVGAGTFVRRTLLPALADAGWGPPVALASMGGRSAASLAERVGEGCEARTVEQVLHADDIDLVVVATTHDALATTTVAALDAGKHVWCEKPLALDEEQLAAVVDAWRASDRSLFVGFNRRHAPATVVAVEHLAGSGGTTVVTARISTGPVPGGHWYGDPRQGGRLLGEGCHWIDQASALVQAPVVSVAAFAGGGPADEPDLSSDVVCALRHADGSTTALTMASGGAPGTPKEHVEVLGGGHTAVLDDLSRLRLDGRRRRLRGHDLRGHGAMIRAFAQSLQTGDPTLTDAALHSVAATLAASRALRDGTVVSVAAP